MFVVGLLSVAESGSEQQCAAGHASLIDKIHARTLQLFPAFDKIRSECITHANGRPFREKTSVLEDAANNGPGETTGMSSTSCASGPARIA